MKRAPSKVTLRPQKPRHEPAPPRDIEAATDIVPLWVAESVVNEAEHGWRTVLPADWPAALAAKAERCFAGHPQFRRLVSAPVGGRDALRRFMRHWLEGRVLRAGRSRGVPHFRNGPPTGWGALPETRTGPPTR